MKKKRDQWKSEGLSGNARHMVPILILLDLNNALRRLTLVHYPYYGLYRYVRSTLPILIDQDLRYLKLVRRYKIVRFKNSIILVQYLKRSSHQSLRFGGGGSP